MAPTEENAKDDRREHILYVLKPLVIYGLIWLNWFAVYGWGSLRFTSSRLNYLVTTVALLLPAIAFSRLFRLPSRRSRWVGALLLGPLAVISVLFFVVELGFLVVLSPEILIHDIDLESEPIRTVAVGNGTRLRVIRTSGGAGTSFGIDVEQERPVLPGVVWRAVVDRAYPASDVKMEVLDSNEVRLSYVSRSERLRKPNIVTLPLGR